MPPVAPAVSTVTVPLPRTQPSSPPPQAAFLIHVWRQEDEIDVDAVAIPLTLARVDELLQLVDAARALRTVRDDFRELALFDGTAQFHHSAGICVGDDGTPAGLARLGSDLEEHEVLWLEGPDLPSDDTEVEVERARVNVTVGGVFWEAVLPDSGIPVSTPEVGYASLLEAAVRLAPIVARLAYFDRLVAVDAHTAAALAAEDGLAQAAWLPARHLQPLLMHDAAEVRDDALRALGLAQAEEPAPLAPAQAPSPGAPRGRARRAP